jgi:hypothetical protein
MLVSTTERRLPWGRLPEAGLSDREIIKRAGSLEYQLAVAPTALARGDITVVREELDELLGAFQLNVDRKSTSYRKLGMAVLTAHVRALRDIEKRNKGEPVETPPSAYSLREPFKGEQGGTLHEAFEGWKKERVRPEGTLREYGRAIDLFIQLHGNLPILQMKRSHARTFREALQLVPRSRKGQLLKAPLPELSEYGRAHPAVQKVASGTVNKQLGAVQAIAGWGRHNGLVPEDAPWSDPFEEMRLEEEQSQREPFDARVTCRLFSMLLCSPITSCPLARRGMLEFGFHCLPCSRGLVWRNTRGSACLTSETTKKRARRSCGSYGIPRRVAR